MSNVTIKKENVQKAYDNGCPDVKKTLERLFPDEFKEENITERVKVSLDETQDGWIGIILHDGTEEIGYVRMSGIQLNQGYRIKENCYAMHFRVIKDGDV